MKFHIFTSLAVESQKKMASAHTHPPRSSRRFLIVGMGLFFFAAMVFAVASQWRLASNDHSTSIEEFPAALQRHGLTCAAPLETKGDAKFPHEKTFEVTVAEKPVWLVYFDPFDPAQAKARADARRSGKLEWDGQPRDAMVCGAVALVGFHGHPEQSKLVKAFIDFQTP